MLRRLATLFCVAALFLVVPAGADQWDKKTTVTFNRPIELPGIVLPAGTYVFRLLDDAGNRHVVQVFNPDMTHLYTTILAIPNYRLKPTSETVMRFAEAKRDNPEPMKAWFYPADNFGQEFVYPKRRATELAVATNTPVLAAAVTPTEKPEELVKEPVVAITPEAKEVPEPTVVEAPPLIAQATPAPAPAAAPAAAPAELPKTATSLPLVALIGFGALAMAAALRAIGRRLA